MLKIVDKNFDITGHLKNVIFFVNSQKDFRFHIPLKTLSRNIKNEIPK